MKDIVLKHGSGLQVALEDFIAYSDSGSYVDKAAAAIESEFTLIGPHNFAIDKKLLDEQSSIAAEAVGADLYNEQVSLIEEQKLLLEQKTAEIERLKAEQLTLAEKFQQGLEVGLAAIKNNLAKQMAKLLTLLCEDKVKKAAVVAFVDKLESVFDQIDELLIIEGNQQLIDIFTSAMGARSSNYSLLIKDSNELYVRYKDQIFATNIEAALKKLKEACE